MMHKKTMTWMLALTLIAGGGLAACGSDSDGGSGSKTTTAADSGDTDGTTGGGSDSANPDVQQFCDDAKALATDLKAVMADPTKGDVAALTQKATELTTSAAQLVSANASDTDEINACAKLITDAVTGG
jgi:hypothetical protein